MNHVSERDLEIKKYLWPRIHSKPRFILGLSCLIVFSILAYAVKTGHMTNLDNALYPLFTDLTAYIPSVYWETFTLFGNIEVVVLLILAMTILLIDAKHYARLAYLLVVSLFGGAMNYAFKGLFASVRPENFLSWFDGHYAFPSGHALITFCLYLALWLAYERHILKLPKPWLFLCAALLAAWLVLLPLSRLVLGVHWTSDVVGGSLLGLGWTLIVFSTYDRRQA